MDATVITSKGQVVIPSRIRKHWHMTPGTRVCFVEKKEGVMLQPLTEEYFEKVAGMLGTKGSLTQALLRERRRDKKREEAKWFKS